MQKTALVPIANGTEEIEAVCIIDTLRRADVSVTVASVETTRQVQCSRGVKLVADALITDLTQPGFDLIAIPGGMPGAEHIRDNWIFINVLKQHIASGKLLGAICAAPIVVLHAHGLLGNQLATCFPSFADQLSNQQAAHERVVVDGALVTSRGPGSAIEFALALVSQLFDAEYAKAIAQRMQQP